MKCECKKRTYIPLILSIFLFTACGSAEYSSESSGNYKAGAYFTDGAAASDYSADNYSNSVSMADNAENYEYAAAEERPAASADSDKTNNTSTEVVKKEMLVYSCNMSIDVLDFQTAIDSFRSSLDTYGAFVENENYSDGGSNSRWYYSDSEKWQTYTATVRIPSSSYDSFCLSTAQLGDLRSKNASVQNMSREYYDLSAELEIYQAKEMRYMELLASITDDQYAVAVEEELTDIQIEISKLKTRMNDIQNDVAYSYVYITINEVKEYTAEPIKTDTFMQRLSNTVSDAASSFLSFMETLLFGFLYLFPHGVIIGLAAFFILSLV